MMDIYDKFMDEYADYPKYLCSLVAKEKNHLVPTTEDKNYNASTMSKGSDGKISPNIAVANAHKFASAASKYRVVSPQMSDMEAQARVVFDFISDNGVNLLYEKNKDDILFDNVTREYFYSEAIYKDTVSNTNFFDKHIGDMQILCMEPKSDDGLPRNTQGLSAEDMKNFADIPTDAKLDILYKRGFYHESIHMAMGTADERKCDVFAMLKIMKEYPEYAKTIFKVYNMQRSKIGYTVKAMHKKEGKNFEDAIKNGTMTYLMPNTYKKLKKYAENPDLIPDNDAELLKLTCKLTSGTEFTKNQLQSFADLMKKEEILSSELKNNEIVRMCMKQGNFSDFEKYLHADDSLKEFIDNNRREKIHKAIGKDGNIDRKQANNIDCNSNGDINKTQNKSHSVFYAKNNVNTI